MRQSKHKGESERVKYSIIKRGHYAREYERGERVDTAVAATTIHYIITSSPATPHDPQLDG